MEHLARAVVVLACVWAGSLVAQAQGSAYFTLSTTQTFAPDDQPKLHLYTRNVAQLEFRVYRVQDEEKFLNGLQDLHDFGEAAASGPEEDIDEKTWLERFHDWKHAIFLRIKSFFRGQLSWETRNAVLERQANLVTRSRVLGVAQFAQIPLLNDKQLVARWVQQVPPTFVSDNQLLPIDPMASGMYLIEATDGHLKAYTILLVSRTALVTRTVNGEMTAFVVDRKTGAPVSGVDVLLSKDTSAARQQTTDADGMTVFAAETKAAPKDAVAAAQDEGAEASDTSEHKLWVLARHGGDVALVAPWMSMLDNSSGPQFSAYAYTERPVYRPGDTVHFKAVLRQHLGTALALPKLTQVHVTAAGADSKKVLDQTLAVSVMGTVEGGFELPKGASLSDYSLAIETADGASITQVSFLVEDYRKPEYQVRVSAAKPRVLQGESDAVTIDARYFFGEPVSGAKVKYRVFENTHYWWDEAADDSDTETSADNGSDDESSTEAGDEDGEKSGTLNADGKLIVPIPTSFDPKKHPDRDYVVEGAVTDEAGREITGRYHFLASYGSFRIHVEPLSYESTAGQPTAFRVTAVDYDNKPVQTAIHLHLFKRKGYGDDAEQIPAGDADVTTGSDGTGTVKVTVGIAGSITVLASAKTPEQRQVEDQTYLWVVGAGRDTDWGNESQQAQLIADKKSYAPGDVAHLTLISEVAGFHAMVTATGDAVEFRKVVTATGRSVSFDVPITRDSQPNLVVDAVFVLDNTLYQARKSLKVPPAQQQLQVTVTPAAQTFQPQQSAVYDVTTNDWKGQPVAAELSFGVVDEAIYALYPDASGDILHALYPTRQVFPDIENSMEYSFTGEAGERSPLLAERRSRYRPQLAQVKPGNDVVQPKIRKAFPDTAFWNPTVKTDASGHARVTLTFPDSLTTWRATVRGITADSKAGSFVNRVIVRKNIIVRMGQPRFLRKGDTVTVPVIVHNYLTQAKQVQVSLEGQGVELLDGATQSLTIPSRGEATVQYHLRANGIGAATLTAKALSNPESDALQVTLPVQPSGVQQTAAASGILAGSGESTPAVRYPDGIDPGSRSLQLQVSPSIAGSMFSALDYLTSFPYGCTEQTMSSFLPNVIVAQAMQSLKLPPHGDPAILNAKIEAGLARLADYQHNDGGWGWWKEDLSQVFMTAYVVSGLAEARKAGYADGTATSSQKGIRFLQTQLQQHPRMLPALRAYVVYALAESGNNDAKQLDTLWSRRKDLDAQALAYTGLAMLDAGDGRAAEIGKLLESQVAVDGEMVHWKESSNDLLEIDEDSSAEATAFTVKLLAHTDPQSPLLAKAAAWLVANRSEGYWWSSTQETAFVIYGLTDYLMVSHELGSESDVEVFVDGASAGKRHFTREDAVKGTTLAITLDASKLHGQPAVRMVTRGSGRTYWSMQANYFSTAKSSYQNGSMSLNIARDYFVLTPTQDKDGHLVYRLQPLRGPVSQGDTLAVHLGVFGSAAKYLLIEDPIPAGTEFLKRTDGYNIVDRPGGWGDWFTRQEFHDDHAAIFSTSFDGRHDSFYLLKVINPGSYEISPARVMPMYQPGMQATSDELLLDVKEVGK